MEFGITKKERICKLLNISDFENEAELKDVDGRMLLELISEGDIKERLESFSILHLSNFIISVIPRKYFFSGRLRVLGDIVEVEIKSMRLLLGNYSKNVEKLIKKKFLELSLFEISYLEDEVEIIFER